QWRRYQAVLQPHESGQGRLDFFLANEAGDVWLDDVHFQQGVYSVYRRDFQNGSVLVNPGNTSLDVVMESPMRRIAGAVSPTINNGTVSVYQTVLPSDAVFLIGTDAISPAAVQDLH